MIPPEDGPRRPARIVQVGWYWSTNIGNAFINMGSLAALRQVAPHAELSRLNYHAYWPGILVNPDDPQVFSILDKVEADLFVVSGMYGGSPQMAAQLAGRDVLYHGIGTTQHSHDHPEFDELAYHLAEMPEVKPIAVFARDSLTYDTYRRAFQPCFKALDCGWFTPEAFSPLPWRGDPFDVLCFDGGDTGWDWKTYTGIPAVLTTHSMDLPKHSDHLFQRPTFLSDNPWGYLTLYAHCRRLYADRIHAVVPALAYGREAMLFGNTPRAQMFDCVGLSEEQIRSAPCKADLDLLNRQKRRHLAYLELVLQEWAERRGLLL